MSLMRRTRNDFDWPSWFRSPFLDVPDVWRDLRDESALTVEEFQEDGALVVRAEMPGIDPDEDVEITVADHTLTLRAERRAASRTEDKKGFRSEFRYGSFTRSVPLPAGVTDEDVKATYRDGILEVRIPIDRTDAEARKIPIERT